MLCERKGTGFGRLNRAVQRAIKLDLAGAKTCDSVASCLHRIQPPSYVTDGGSIKSFFGKGDSEEFHRNPRGKNMRALFIVAVAAFVVTLTGCATQGVSSANYTPGPQNAVKNEKTITRAQAIVWDELVRELSKSFYVINNIERESRIINVSFNTNAPTDYVDCGRTRRTYTQGDKVETFEYDVANSATFKVAGTSQPHPSMFSYAVMRRTPALEGRSNIYVAPDPSNPTSTVISVNTRYVLSVRVDGESIVQHIGGNIMNRTPLRPPESSMIFNTNKPSTTMAGDVAIICASKGRLETEILKMVQ